jgi:hypothetical protein
LVIRAVAKTARLVTFAVVLTGAFAGCAQQHLADANVAVEKQVAECRSQFQAIITPIDPMNCAGSAFLAAGTFPDLIDVYVADWALRLTPGV